MTESSPPAGDPGHRRPMRPDAPRIFEHIERWIEVGIGIILSAAAILALTGALALAWDGVIQWPEGRSLFVIVDRLLFVLMIVEILYTVRTSMQSHQMAAEPFLIVGMIATIRRILVVTLESSDQRSAGQPSGGATVSFEHAMIELAVLALLTLVLAIAIYLSRRANARH